MRHIRVLCLLACLLCLCISASRADQSCYLPVLSMRVSVPDDWDVFTRNMDPDASVLKQYGETPESINDLLIPANIYLDAVPDGAQRELTIIMTENEIQDLSLFDDETLDYMQVLLGQRLEEQDISCTDIRKRKIGEITYFIIDEENTQDQYAVECFTIHDYRTVIVTLYSYGEPVSDADRNMLMRLLETAQYDVEPKVEILNKDAGKGTTLQGPTYTDRYGTCTFTLPYGWSETNFTSDKQYLNVKFKRNDGSIDTIMFGVADLYSESGLSEDTVPRSLVGENLFTEENLASMGYDPASVTQVTYNGAWYYQTEMNTDMMGLQHKMIMLLACRNGYVYMFQFSALNEVDTDLIRLVMDSVRYT